MAQARKSAINFIGVFFDSFDVLTFLGCSITGGLTYARKGREQCHDHRPHHTPATEMAPSGELWLEGAGSRGTLGNVVLPALVAA